MQPMHTDVHKLRGCREAWHLRDKVDTVSRLQWGRHSFANLRHANMTCPQHWTCPMSWNR